MTEDPRVLMMRYVDGDAEAFRELYRLLAPRLLGYLLRMTRDRARADDLLQQTFFKVHRARAAYVRGADPVPWMYAIAHRTFLDDVRARKRGAGVTDTGDVPEVAAVITGASAVADAEQAPVDPELAQAALRALDTLPPQQREAVVPAISAASAKLLPSSLVSTTAGAMKVRAHRGYVALRKALGGTS